MTTDEYERDTAVMASDPDSWWLDEAAHAGREHFDEQHARRYDAKMDAGSAEEVAVLQSAAVLGPQSTVVELGTGTGQFAMAAAQVCRRVVAVDISPVMLARLREKLDRGDASNVETVDAGFLTYEHTGGPADAVYSRFALHHLPDFWQAIALRRMAGMLRPGGVLRLSDVVYSFEPADAERCIEAWITDLMTTDIEAGWTRAEIAEHVRDENSTFTWLLEPMIARAGFEIIDATYSASRMLAQYLCRKR
ncbi:MAG TPA: class I SAM-dependent methyltransferase [Solirubrobacteraceae bacterium]|nr:class I SAM-dependent methyltransferase [Solirubrobacteraceae bacterium]